MAINTKQLSEYVIKPTLESFQLKNFYSDDAVFLLLCTAAQESSMGTYIKQIKGPAIGIYQMEPKTYNDIYKNYLRYKPLILEELKKINLYNLDDKELITNLKLSTIFARLQYYRQKEQLPNSSNLCHVWRYYKKYYNTEIGKATKDDFMANVEKYVLGQL